MLKEIFALYGGMRLLDDATRSSPPSPSGNGSCGCGCLLIILLLVILGSC